MKVRECQTCVDYLMDRKEILLTAVKFTADVYGVTEKEVLLAYISTFHLENHDESALGKEYDYNQN